MHIRNSLYFGSLVLSGMLVSPQARAEEIAAVAVEPNAGIAEIVVTARRKDEQIQDVPLAITAVSGSALEQRGIQAVESLRAVAPGLNISGQRRDEANFYLRGQGPGALNPSQRNFTSVATYFAEVPTEVTGSGMFFDLASVQVLKGPQGTLFGRNTTGGAVLFEPNRPTQDAEGYLKATIGNFDHRELEAMVNIPLLADRISLRLAGNAARRDGFTESVITKQKLDGRNYRSFRASLLITPTDEIENLTIFDFRKKDQSGTSAILRQVNPSSSLAPYLTNYLAQQKALGIRKTLIDQELFDRQENWGLTNKTSWNVSDNVTIKNIVSFRKNRLDRASDYDGTPFQSLLNYNSWPNYKWQSGLEQFTEELQLQTVLPDAGLNFILGVYYEKAKPGFTQNVRQNSFGAINTRFLDSSDTSKAIFVHAEKELTANLQLSGGFRYTWDHRRATISTRNDDGICTQQVPPGSGTVVCPDSESAKFGAASYDATLQYKLTPDALMYAAYRHGYKSGGVNLPSPGVDYTRFAPESVDEVEVGMKADWNIGVPFRTNIAFFIDKYNDIQISTPVNIPGAGIASLVRNAAKATNKGLEIETTLVPMRGVTLSANLSYLDAHSDVTVAGTAAVKGRQTAFQPKWKYGFSGQFELLHSESVGDAVLALDYSWQGRANTSDVVANIDTFYPSYGIANASLTIDNLASTKASLSLFAKNIFNKDYILGGLPLADAIGFESSFYGEPRTYGVSLKTSF